MFEDFCAETGKGSVTRLNYLSSLRKCCEFIGKDFSAFTANDCIKYSEHLIAETNCGNLSVSTASYKIRSLSSIAEYAREHKKEYGFNKNFVNGFANINKPYQSTEINPKTIISPDDFEKLLSFAKATYPILHLEILFASLLGLSIGEVVAIRQSDIVIDLDGRYQYVQYLGKDTRTIPISDNFMNDIDAYRSKNPDCKESKYLFPSTLDPAKHQSKENARRMMRVAREKLGIDTTFASLRNCLGVYMYQGGASLDDIGTHLRIRTEEWVKRYQKACDHVNYTDFSIFTAIANHQSGFAKDLRLMPYKFCTDILRRANAETLYVFKTTSDAAYEGFYKKGSKLDDDTFIADAPVCVATNGQDYFWLNCISLKKDTEEGIRFKNLLGCFVDAAAIKLNTKDMTYDVLHKDAVKEVYIKNGKIEKAE